MNGWDEWEDNTDEYNYSLGGFVYVWEWFFLMHIECCVDLTIHGGIQHSGPAVISTTPA